MQIDDQYIFNLIIELMSIRGETETIEQLRGWINDKGLDVVFKLVVGMETDINVGRMEPYEDISEHSMENADEKENQDIS